MSTSLPSLNHRIGAPSDTEAPRKKAPERHIPRENSLELGDLFSMDDRNEKKLRANESNRTEGTEPGSWNQSTGSSLLNHSAGFLSSSSSPLGGASLSSSLPPSVAVASNDSKMTAPSSSVQPKEMNKKGAAAVQFHPSIRIRAVPSLSFMSDEERGSIWYCGDELENFQEGIRKDVMHMRKFPDLPPGHILDTAERCCRGIEHFASREALDARETPKRTLLSSILQVQTQVRSAAASVDVPVGDDEAARKMQRAIGRTISSVSTQLSLEARSRAAMLGASDRAFVAAEEAGLRAWLASYSLASPTAPTDVHSGRDFAAAATTANNTAASSVQPTPAGPSLKRSASSSPNMMMTRTTTSTSTSSANSSAALHAYEQFATHRRRRLSNLREELMQRMTISDTTGPTAPTGQIRRQLP